MLCSKGYAIITYEYNSAGKVNCTRYYDENGQLMLTPNQEYAFVKTSTFADLRSLGEDVPEGDAAGTDSADGAAGDGDETAQAENAGEDAAGTDAEEETDQGIQETNYIVSDNGNLVQAGDASDEPMEESTDNGAIVEYYGADGKLMNLAAGYSYIVREMDKAGHVTRETYYDRAGNMVNLTSGYAYIVKTYDRNGYLSGESYFDTAGQKVTLADGYHAYTRENDRNGNATVVAYFDANGAPVNHVRSLYHRIERTYLDSSHVLTEAWFDRDGAPITNGDTYVRIERSFDRMKNKISEITCGANGEPVAKKDGTDETRWNTTSGTR